LPRTISPLNVEVKGRPRREGKIPGWWERVEEMQKERREKPRKEGLIKPSVDIVRRARRLEPGGKGGKKGEQPVFHPASKPC